MILTQQNMFYGLKFPGSQTDIDEIARDPSIPVLIFPGILWQEIRHITHKLSTSEYALFLTLRRLDPKKPHFIASALHMPKQTASSAGVQLDTKNCETLWAELGKDKYLAENGLHRHICHLHSHASMNVFWSAVDNEQQLSHNDLGFLDDFRFYVVVNAKDEILCSYVNYRPVLFRVNAAVALSFSEPEHCEYLTSARKKELDALIDAKLTRQAPRAVSPVGKAGDELRVLPADSKYDWRNYSDYGDYYGGYGFHAPCAQSAKTGQAAAQTPQGVAPQVMDNKFADLKLPLVRDLSPTLKRIVNDKEAVRLFAYSAGCMPDDPLAGNALAWFANILLEFGVSEQLLRTDVETLGNFVSEIFEAIDGMFPTGDFVSSDAVLKIRQAQNRAQALQRIVLDELAPLYLEFEEDLAVGNLQY